MGFFRHHPHSPRGAALMGLVILCAFTATAGADSWPGGGDVQVMRGYSSFEQFVPLGEPCHVTWNVTPMIGQALEGLFISEQFPDWLQIDAIQAHLDEQIVQVHLEYGQPDEIESGLRPVRFIFWDPESQTDLVIYEGSTLRIEYDLTSEVAGLLDLNSNGWFGRLQSEPHHAVGGWLEEDHSLQFGQTPLTLQSFEVTDAGGHLALAWSLILEGENEEFRLQRGDGPDPHASRPLGEPIATGAGDYRFDDHGALLGRDYWYWIVILDADGDPARYLGPATGHLAGMTPPLRPTLSSYPNPFNPRTVLRFHLPEAGRGNLAVYDARGRRLRVLASGVLDAGDQEWVWDGRDDTGGELPSGAYFARLKIAGESSLLSKLILIR
jgi:hypothetical protein